MVRKRRIVKTVAGVLCCVALASFGLIFVHSAGRDAESYAAYSAYLESGRTGDSHDFGDRHGLMLILDHTSTGTFRILFPLHSSTYPKPAEFDMAIRNLVSRRLGYRFDLAGTYRLIPTPDLSALSDADRRASYGVMTLSQVTFNRDRTWAVFYAEHLCGLCGGGEFVTMQKSGGHWVVVAEDSTWVS
jgi:hypothetical protein